MTTASFIFAGTNSSVTTFRAWGSALSAALDTVGFPKTADAGQVDWATVAVPGGAATKAGYEIRRFSDALQATAPIVFRIDYGSGTNVTYPSIWMTIGKGSDGAGNITSVLLAALQGAATNVTTAVASYVSSGDKSLLAMSLWPTHANTVTFLMERSRTPIGVPSAVAVMYAGKIGSGTNAALRVYNYTTGLLSPGLPLNAWPAAVPTSAAAGLVAGGLAPVFPAIVSDGVGNYWQPRALVSYAPPDAGMVSPISVPGWGTYLPIGNTLWGYGEASGAIAWS